LNLFDGNRRIVVLIVPIVISRLIRRRFLANSSSAAISRIFLVLERFTQPLLLSRAPRRGITLILILAPQAETRLIRSLKPL